MKLFGRNFISRRVIRILLVSFVISSALLIIWFFFSENNSLNIAPEVNIGHNKAASVIKKGAIMSVPSEVVKFEDGVENNLNDVYINNEKSTSFPPVNYNLHVFYYPWYGNPKFDGQYYHWNHQILPHWNKMEAKKWPEGKYIPPDNIGSHYYPELGAYSSQDPFVLDTHMQQIRMAGAGVLSLSWYPPGDQDEQGQDWNHFVPKIFDFADKYQLKVCFHIEPFKGRTHLSLRKAIQYIIENYGSHPALYRHNYHGIMLPLFYIYDSYLIKSDDWKDVLLPQGSSTVRGTELDGIFIGLLLDDKDKFELKASGFDGFYTYFAADGFTFGSTSSHWKALGSFAKDNELLFIPCVGPGYIDERIRPWNHKNTRDREGGVYYENHFKAAVDANTQFIAVTSFNEWHEGTQIETAVSKDSGTFKYLDYAPGQSDYYLSLTRKWSFKFKARRNRLTAEINK